MKKKRERDMDMYMDIEEMCCALSLNCVRFFETPWTVAHQTPLFMGILQPRILEWLAMPSSRGSSQPRDQTQVSHIAGRFFNIWATREAQEYWSGYHISSPGHFPVPGIEPGSPALQTDSLPAEPLMTREPQLAWGIFFKVELGVKFVNGKLPTLADAN